MGHVERRDSILYVMFFFIWLTRGSTGLLPKVEEIPMGRSLTTGHGPRAPCRAGIILKHPETVMAGMPARCAVGLTRCAQGKKGRRPSPVLLLLLLQVELTGWGGLNRTGNGSSEQWRTWHHSVCWEFVNDYRHPPGMMVGATRKQRVSSSPALVQNK